MLKEMLKQIAEGRLVESKESFVSIIGEKLQTKLNEAKVEIAKSLMNEKKEKEDDEEDESSEEESDESFAKHPLNQLQKIASAEEGIPLKYPETTASGEPDKRSIRAATDRIKSGKSTSGIPMFKHKDGSETKVSPEDAKHLVNVLQGSAIKPETKQKAFDALHGSKEGFSKIHSALTGKVVAGKSIYGSDVRESEQLDEELNEISKQLANKVYNARSKQASDIWYNAKKTQEGPYNPENPEYKKKNTQAIKAKDYMMKKPSPQPNKSVEYKPRGGFDPVSNKSYSD
jgi:hypothetical protein